MEDNDILQSEATLTEDVRNIVGGVLGLVLVIVPVLLIRKLVKSIEGSEAFGNVTNKLGSL